MATTYHGGGSQSPTSISKPLERVFEDAQHTGEIQLSGRKLREFPKLASKYDLVDTITADMSKNRLSDVPKEVCTYLSMEKFNCYHNVIRSIPEAIVQLQSLTYLNLSRNQLSIIPSFISQLQALEVLIACHNRLVSLPEEIGVLDKLMELDVSCNEIQHLPVQIGDLKSLRSFNVRRNLLQELPVEISKLNLRRLNISGNRVSKIPYMFRRIETLEEIILHDNPLATPPAHICTRGKQHIMKYLEIEAKREDKKRLGILTEVEMKRFRKSLPPQQSVSSEEFRNLVDSPDKWKRHTVLSSDSGYSTTDSIEKIGWGPQEGHTDPQYMPDPSSARTAMLGTSPQYPTGRDLQRREPPEPPQRLNSRLSPEKNVSSSDLTSRTTYTSPPVPPTLYGSQPSTPLTPPTPQGPGPGLDSGQGILGTSLEDEFTRELQRQKQEYENKKKIAEQLRIQQEEEDEKEQRRRAAQRIQDEQRALLERQREETRVQEEQQQAWEEARRREAEELKRQEEARQKEAAEQQRLAEEAKQREEAKQQRNEHNFYYKTHDTNYRSASPNYRSASPSTPTWPPPPPGVSGPYDTNMQSHLPISNTRPSQYGQHGYQTSSHSPGQQNYVNISDDSLSPSSSRHMVTSSRSYSPQYNNHHNHPHQQQQQQTQHHQHHQQQTVHQQQHHHHQTQQQLQQQQHYQHQQQYPNNSQYNNLHQTNPAYTSPSQTHYSHSQSTHGSVSRPDNLHVHSPSYTQYTQSSHTSHSLSPQSPQTDQSQSRIHVHYDNQHGAPPLGRIPESPEPRGYGHGTDEHGRREHGYPSNSMSHESQSGYRKPSVSASNSFKEERGTGQYYRKTGSDQRMPSAAGHTLTNGPVDDTPSVNGSTTTHPSSDSSPSSAIYMTPPQSVQSTNNSPTDRPTTGTRKQKPGEKTTTSKVAKATTDRRTSASSTTSNSSRSGVPTARKGAMNQDEEIRKSQTNLKGSGVGSMSGKGGEQRLRTIQKEAANNLINRRSSGSTSSEDDRKRSTPTRSMAYQNPASSSAAKSSSATASSKRSGTVMTNAQVRMLDESFTMRRHHEQQKENSDQIEALRKTISSRLKRTLPDNLSDALSDGVLLCNLINQIRPRSVASVHVPSPAVPKLPPPKCRKNVENFLEACRKMGVPKDQLCEASDILQDRGMVKVALTVAALVAMSSNSRTQPSARV